MVGGAAVGARLEQVHELVAVELHDPGEAQEVVDEIEDRVVDSRESRDSGAIRRRRECLGCNRRFTTYEKVEEIAYKVVKIDGTRQDFDPAKLLKGLEKACEKRPVAPLQLEQIAEAGIAVRLHDGDYFAGGGTAGRL